MTKLSPDDAVRKALVDIMRHPKWAAFSGVLAAGKRTITTSIPTACTDGLNIKLNPDFVASLNEPQLRLLLLHEALHIAFRHLRIWVALWSENPQLANIAADHYVNLALIEGDAGEGFLAMPDVGVQPDTTYHGWSVQMIYEDLKQNPPPPPRRGKGKGKGKGQGQGQGQPDDGQGGQGTLDSHDWEAAQELTEQQAAQQAQEIDRALRQGEAIAKKLGKGMGASNALIGDLLKPQQNWVEVLRAFILDTCRGHDESTWARVRRRFIADDTYMPGSESVVMGPLVIGFDVSGSCFSGTVLQRLVSELQGIIDMVRPESVRVVYWDTVVQGEQLFEDGTFAVANLKVRGGGGTDGSVLFDYLREKRITPSAIIQFTDGEVGSWGKSDTPTLWAVTDKRITAPWGQTVHIDI